MNFSGKELLLWRTRQLSKGGSEAELDWLLDMGAGLDWSSLQKIYIDPLRSLRLKKSLKELAIIWREYLEKQIPLQYLIGKCNWRDFELEINSQAMIPRPETELLVDFALKRFKNEFAGRWVDLGTGSGALSVALARSFPDWEGHAVDCSKEALDLANRNLQRLAPGSNIFLHFGNWWEPVKPWWGSISLVLANPPYIPKCQIDQLEPEVRNHEPYLALCGGLDGLSSCRKVVSGAFQALEPEGWLLLEHHHDQSDQLLDLMDATGLKNVQFENDLNGIRRFALGCHP